MDTTKYKLNKEPYKGTRDFYPADMFIQNYIFSVMRKVSERYGYSEYTASILEETALYTAKSGSEIVNEQTYSFQDRGGREVTIRPEMTPTVARMVARKRQEFSFPLRWYSIPNLFRYEKPQRGRLREHWQLNVDVFGADNIEADAEVIAIAWEIMLAFGAKKENFSIRLNNRRLINYIFADYFKFHSDTAYLLSKLIDKKAKMPRETFVEGLQTLVPQQTDEILNFLETPHLADLPKDLQNNRGFEELTEITKLLEQKGITNFSFDPTLVRGFDYYTGTVFEVFDTNPQNSRSLFGGGRYDDLVSIFDVDSVTGVGFGMGDVTIHDYLETYNLLPDYTSQTRLYICKLDNNQNKFIEELSMFLRKEGVNVAIDYTDRKIPAQIKTAEKQGIPYIVCIGEDEVQSKIFKLKHLKTRTEQEVKWEDLPNMLK